MPHCTYRLQKKVVYQVLTKKIKMKGEERNPRNTPMFVTKVAIWICEAFAHDFDEIPLTGNDLVSFPVFKSQLSFIDFCKSTMRTTECVKMFCIGEAGILGICK